MERALRAGGTRPRRRMDDRRPATARASRPRPGARCRRFLVAGGDGSVHDVVNGLMRGATGARRPASTGSDRTPTVVPLPLGTGNDWARSLGLPNDPTALAALIRRGNTVSHDVGRIDFAESRPATTAQTCWFINVAGAGFDAHVIERMPARTPSRLAYLCWRPARTRALSLAGIPAGSWTTSADTMRSAGCCWPSSRTDSYCGGRHARRAHCTTGRRRLRPGDDRRRRPAARAAEARASCTSATCCATRWCSTVS